LSEAPTLRLAGVEVLGEDVLTRWER